LARFVETNRAKSKDGLVKMFQKVNRRYPFKQETRHKKIAKALNVPRDTVGSIVRKIKVNPLAVTPPF